MKFEQLQWYYMLGVLLIVPEGIEICILIQLMKLLNLLIVPEGIEITLQLHTADGGYAYF